MCVRIIYACCPYAYIMEIVVWVAASQSKRCAWYAAYSPPSYAQWIYLSWWWEFYDPGHDDNRGGEMLSPSRYVDLVVKVRTAMMLPSIFLTVTPSNRTSRARADWVTGWRVRMNYNELLICNPGCDPVCNTGVSGRFCQRSAGSSR